MKNTCEKVHIADEVSPGWRGRMPATNGRRILAQEAHNDD